MRPTVFDVAEAAGVSLATVDRVINRRSGVRHETVAKVEAAIARLGFVRDMSAVNLAKQRVYRLVFIIPDGANSFMRRLESELEQVLRLSRLNRTEIAIVKVPPFDGAALAAALNAIDTGSVSGVALVATESPLVREALSRLHREKVHVVTLVSDAPAFPRGDYVGIDNVAAGRTAASLVGRFAGRRSGAIALTGTMLVRDHAERRLGFEQVIAAEYPHLTCLPVIEGRDDAETVRKGLAACLKERPDIVGIYNMGAGNRGLLEVLASDPAYAELVVIGHELTDHTREALRTGLIDAIINQDAGHEVRSAVRILRARIDGTPVIAGQENIRIEIYLRDNLP